MAAVAVKTLPPRPTGPYVDPWLTDDLWALMEACWEYQQEDRPTMAAVVERLRVIKAGVRK